MLGAFVLLHCRHGIVAFGPLCPTTVVWDSKSPDSSKRTGRRSPRTSSPRSNNSSMRGEWMAIIADISGYSSLLHGQTAARMVLRGLFGRFWLTILKTIFSDPGSPPLSKPMVTWTSGTVGGGRPPQAPGSKLSGTVASAARSGRWSLP